MSSQNEWNELEARANQQRARLRLQQRQVCRRNEAQESAAVAAGEEPVLALTQAELAVLSRRYATPSTGRTLPLDTAASLIAVGLRGAWRVELLLDG
ncbi:hypothetical protein PC128_g9827 [Phytophthora cactorum]|nr:hypothetical protein PC128_g9827 [Phytophthora cactorum]KAG4041807.1 hypothetical protein PC123_g22685 [Phytophthora cactorum]